MDMGMRDRKTAAQKVRSSLTMKYARSELTSGGDCSAVQTCPSRRMGCGKCGCANAFRGRTVSHRTHWCRM